VNSPQRRRKLDETRTAHFRLNGYALALDRDTGDIVWSNNQMKSGYATFLLDGDR
jgi:hypothetical protein